MKTLRFATFALAAVMAACGSPDAEPTDECGPNGECPPGFTCQPQDRRCVANGGGAPDAGAAQPDAAEQLGCAVPTGGPTLHTASISADETWTANGSPHIVASGQIRVLGSATLTIEPCAEVQLGKDVVIVAGFGGATSTIRALGTQARPITIKQKTAGERFDDIEAVYPGKLELAWVTVEGGGSDRFRRGASITGWGDSQAPAKPVVKVDHVTVKDSAGLGVVLERNGTFVPGSTALTVTGSGLLNGGEGEAVRIDAANMGDVPDGVYRGNALDAVTVYGGNVERAIVLRDLGVPYRLAPGTTLNVKSGGSLELGAGVELQVPKGQPINVLGGSLVAKGTEADPVRLRPQGPAADNRWLHLEVDHPGTLSLTHTVIEGSGDDRFTSYASIVARGDSQATPRKLLHVDHVTVSGSGGIGVLVERNAAFDDSSTDLVVTGSGAAYPTAGQAARIMIPQAHTLPAGSYTGNAIDGIVLDSSQYIVADETIRDRGVPYYPTGSIVVRPPTQDALARLTIEPGVTLKFPKGLFGVVVGVGSTGSAAWPGELVAEGTAEKPITFTSADPAPAAGDWRGIYFQGYRPTGNKLVHTRVEYAGASCLCSVGGCAGAEEAGVMFFLYPLEEAVVSQSSFAHISGHGIYSNFRSDAQNLDMTLDNSFEDVAGCEQTMIVSESGQCARQCM